MNLGVAVIKWVSDRGDEIDADNRFYTKAGAYITTLDEFVIKAIRAGRRWAGMSWEPFKEPLEENE